MVEGSITAVDPAAPSPSIQVTLANGRVLTMSVERSASIVKNDAPAKLEDVKLGERAKVRFTMRDGGHVAQRLDVTGSPSSSSPSADSPPLPARAPHAP